MRYGVGIDKERPEIRGIPMGGRRLHSPRTEKCAKPGGWMAKAQIKNL